MAKGSVRKKGKKWYHRNYYREVQDKNKVYYEYYSLGNTQDIQADYNEISFVCL